MSYCLNPTCQKPQNPNNTKFCLTCGSKVLLRERYRALKPIGQGGFGKTFLAADEDIPSRPLCVIKQFFPLSQGTSNTEKAAELFRREAERLDELGKHPQIPDLLAHFEQDGHQYLVQEFIEGQNLEQELANGGLFDEAQIRRLLEDLLPVLHFVHERQVIHRDIKPANIIRRSTQSPQPHVSVGQLVLVDFGAAKVLNSGPVLAPGTIIGSPEYVAPEQTRGQAVFASDLYSLGVTCIHLLTQMSPFDLFDINQDIWVWRDFLTTHTISHQLGTILDRMLQTVPSQRYASAMDVLKALNPQWQSAPISPWNPPPVSYYIPSAAKNTTAAPALPQLPRTAAPPVKTQKCLYTLTGHFNPVTSVAFSPDGKILASGSGDKTIEIWQLATGKRWYTLTGHSDWVRCLAFSPDGEMLASGSSDKTVLIWQMRTGKLWYTLTGHGDGVYAVAFSPNSQLLASGSRDGRVHLWPLSQGNLPAWSPLRTLTSHTDGVYAATFSPDGQTLATGSRDGTVHLWQISADGKPQRSSLRILKGHSDWVRTAAFSSDGELLASGSREGRVLVWSMGTPMERAPRYQLEMQSKDVLSVAFSPHGEILAIGKSEGTIDLWTVKTGQHTSFAAHREDVLSVAFSPNGQLLASGSRDKSIKIWEV